VFAKRGYSFLLAGNDQTEGKRRFADVLCMHDADAGKTETTADVPGHSPG
jgi:hypothetical protein